MDTRITTLAFGAAAIGTLAMGSTAHAAGVEAGTIIQNTASASYQSGSATQTVDSNTVELLVDELLDVAVASVSATPDANTAVFTFTVTNTGNGNEAYYLTADPAVAGNDFDYVVTGIAIDSNNNGVYDSGDTIVPAGTPTSEIAPDGDVTVFVLVELPADAADGETSQVRLTATSETGSGPAGTVFAGEGQGGGDAVTGVSTAEQDATNSLTASLATVALTKSATVSDPFGGTQAIPGATVTFTIVATATGSGSVSGLTITDAIPADTTYKAGTLTLQGASLTDASDTDAGQASDAGVSVTVPTLNGGDSRSVTFAVTIDN